MKTGGYDEGYKQALTDMIQHEEWVTRKEDRLDSVVSTFAVDSTLIRQELQRLDRCDNEKESA